MDDKKKENPWITLKTPKATSTYLYLAKRDTKYKAEGQNSITVRLDPKDPTHAEFIKSVTAANQAVFDKKIKDIKKERSEYRVKTIVRDEYDKDGNPTGFKIFKASTTRPFTVFGPDQSIISPEALKKIWGGSTCRILCQLKEWVDSSKKNIGYIVYFTKVQFIDIKSGDNGSSDSSSCPFDAEEGSGADTLGSSSDSDPGEATETGGNF